MAQSTAESHPEVFVDSNEKKLIRVLHVDDEPSLLRIAKQCLEMEGQFQVTMATSVDEALDKIRNESYDAIISDHQMPGKDGLEFLKELRASGKKTPFIMFTGKGREEVAIKAWSLGADHYVNKNGDPEIVYCELSHAIRKTVEATRAEEERKMVDASLKSLGEKYRRLFESAVEGIVINGSNGKILSINPAAVSILGYSNSSELVGRPAVELYANPESRVRLLQELLEKDYVKDRELTWKKKDGTPIEIMASITAQKDENGNLLRTEGIIRDVTEKKKTEDSLRESEAKHRSLVEQSLQGILIAQGPTPHIVFANAAMSQILDYTPEEMTSFTPQQTLNLVHPDDRELFFGRFKERLEGKSPPSNYEFRGIKRDGTVVWLGVSSSHIDYGGQPAVQAILMDVTERKRMEEELRISEEKFRTLFNEAIDAIFVADAETGTLLDCNQAATELIGRTKPEIIGTHQRTLHPEMETKNDRFTKTFKEHQGERQGQTIEDKVITKSGEIKDVAIKANIVEVNGRKLLQGIFRDITEWKKTEEELRESEERYRELFESIQDPVCICVGKGGHLKHYNVAFKELFGYADEELRNKVFLDFVRPDDRTMIMQKYQTGHQAEEFPIVFEIMGERKKGESIPLEVSVSPYKKRGIVIGVEVTYRDMTERQRHERCLSGLNLHSRKLNTAKSMEEIYELTLDAADKTLGFEFADVFITEGKMLNLMTHRGKTKISSLSLPIDGDKGISVKAARTGKPVLVPDISKEEAYVEGEEAGRSELAVPIKIGPRVLGVLNVESKELDAFNEKDQELLEILASHAATAISNLDRAGKLETYAREAQETKHKFEGLFVGNPEAAVHVGPDFRVLDVNPRFEILFGYKLDEIKGKNINDVVVPKGKIDEAHMLDSRAEEDKHVNQATVRRKKDGSMVPVFVSAAPITVEGRFLGYVAVYKDISELKNTEKKLEIMNEKLRVVGGLTRHDVRNKLSAITGNAYLLKKQLASDTGVLDKLRDMEAAVQQTIRIFDFAKAYEMLGVEELSYVDVAKTLDEAVSLFSDQINIKVINDCCGLAVLADSLVRQLFYNLIDNSRKYGKKVTRIRVGYEETGEDQLKLIYEDDGIGIPAIDKPKLFRQGYSTGGSTGYGLYMISKMMEVYGWTIQETGTPGGGAQFTITIPKTNTIGKENYQLH